MVMADIAQESSAKGAGTAQNLDIVNRCAQLLTSMSVFMGLRMKAPGCGFGTTRACMAHKVDASECAEASMGTLQQHYL